MDRRDATAGLSADYPPAQRVNRKWPNSFWALLKVLCLYHHRTVVVERRCQHCHFKYLRKMAEACNKDRGNLIGNIDLLANEYESKGICHVEGRSSQLTGVGGNPTSETELLVGVQNVDQCEVCEAWWLNADGRCERYNERDIGVRLWNHPGSGLIASTIIFALVGLYFYRIIDALKDMWARGSAVLQLIIMMTFFTSLLFHPLMVFGSKLRSIFSNLTPNMSWASTFNVRYLVKRAQLMALEKHGLPGKVYLAMCILLPLFNGIFTAVIPDYYNNDDCASPTTIVVRMILVLILLEYWGLFMYLLYFIRVSLQRQFSILLFYFKQNEGKTDKCRGALCTTLIDFQCFRTAVNRYLLVTMPLFVLGIVTTITQEYMLRDRCPMSRKSRWMFASNAVLGWTEITMGVIFYVVSFGGVHVEYMLSNFVSHLRYMRSDLHSSFWDRLIKDASHFVSNPYPLLLTIAFSVNGIIMGVHFTNQDIATALCNSTHIKC